MGSDGLDGVFPRRHDLQGLEPIKEVLALADHVRSFVEFERHAEGSALAAMEGWPGALRVCGSTLR
ncbi:MAG: hypothetical protein AAF531_03375 [Actinomycetota bacterium]